jgi:signal transduction histidine kinase/CheY-like chemotaxis protein/PAS domain-containing protein
MPDLLKAIHGGGGSDRVQVLRVVRIAVLSVSAVSLLLVALLQPDQMSRALGALSVCALLFVLSGVIVARGAVRTASWVLMVGVLALITTTAFEGGGVNAPGIRALLVFVWVTGVLLGERAATGFGVACLVVIIALGVLQQRGVIDATTPYHPVGVAVLYGMYLALTIVVMRLFARSMARTLDESATVAREQQGTLRRLDRVLQAAGVGIWQYDATTRRYHGDRHLHAILGTDDLQGAPVPESDWLALVHPDDLEALLDHRRAAAELREERQQRLRVQHPPGHWRTLDVTYAPDDSAPDSAQRVIGIVIDRTAAVESDATTAQMAFDLRERVKELTVLHEWSKLLRPEQRFDGKLLDRLVAATPAAFLHPESVAVRIRFAGQTAATPGFEERASSITFPIQTSESAGEITVVDLDATAGASDPFLAEERQLVATLTEMLTAYLERDLAQRSRDRVEHALRQAGKMESLGTLAGGIAHDFNNILTTISTNIALARGVLPSDSEAIAALAEVDRSQTRAKDLVRRILLFSKQTGSELRPIGLHEIVDDVRLMLRPSLSRGATLVVEVDADVPPILADPTQVHQALLNLATNAAFAMRATEGTLTIRATPVTTVDEPLVGGTVLIADRYVRLDVIDTGAGIEPALVDRLFDPFFTTKGAEGTGLGLAVVYGVMREHRGGIAVESTVGEGTRFSLYFPQATQVGAAPSADTVIVRGRGERILFVDDESSITFAMSRLLAGIGYACDPFNDPVEALQAFRTEPGRYDIAILDISMPGLDGRELATALLGIRPHLPVLLCSGYSGEALELDPSLREVAIVAKPVDMPELSRALAAQLRRG